MTEPTKQAPSLWADLNALERFPFAATAHLYRSPSTRKVFVDRVSRDNNGGVCPYSALRGLLRDR